MSLNQPVKVGLTHFLIDAKASRFTVRAFAAGLLSAMGHNPTIGIRGFGGEVVFDPDTMAAGGFRLTIQAASLVVEDDIRDRDRREIERAMREDVLEVSQFPEIRYEAESIAVSALGESLYSATLNGTLSLHGVTRNQPVTARIANFGEILRASGEFTLKQSDYQIRPIVVAAGALKLKDELKFSFEMVTRKQG